MSILSKTTSIAAKPVTRGFCTGWNNIGRVNRTPDSRTRKELMQSIDAYSQNNETVKNLAKEIKTLDDKTIGTISDLLELANSLDIVNNADISVDVLDFNQTLNN